MTLLDKFDTAIHKGDRVRQEHEGREYYGIVLNPYFNDRTFKTPGARVYVRWHRAFATLEDPKNLTVIR